MSPEALVQYLLQSDPLVVAATSSKPEGLLSCCWKKCKLILLLKKVQVETKHWAGYTFHFAEIRRVLVVIVTPQGMHVHFLTVTPGPANAF